MSLKIVVLAKQVHEILDKTVYRAPRKKCLPVVALMVVTTLLLTSCHNELPASQVTVRGDQCKYLSSNFRSQLRRAMKKEKNDYLVVDYDKNCPSNDYLKKQEQNGVRYYIKVYKSPKLIKGTIDGNADLMLRGKYAKEYFTIQQKYAKGGNRDRAIKEMLALMLKVSRETRNQSWAKRVLAEGAVAATLGDAANFVLEFCLPYDNVWGKYILYPVYMLGYWAVATTGNPTSGLFLVALFFVWLMALVTALGFNNIRKGKRTITMVYDLGYSILGLVALFFLLLVAYYVARPCYENVLVMRNVYAGSLNLAESYKNAVFVPSSFWLMLATVAVCVASTTIGGAIDYIHSPTEKLRKMAQDKSAESTGKTLGNAIFLLLVCAFLDRNIVLALLIYYSIHLLRNMILYVTPVCRWCVKNPAGFLLIVTVLCGTLFYFLV